MYPRAPRGTAPIVNYPHGPKAAQGWLNDGEKTLGTIEETAWPALSKVGWFRAVVTPYNRTALVVFARKYSLVDPDWDGPGWDVRFVCDDDGTLALEVTHPDLVMPIQPPALPTSLQGVGDPNARG